MRKKKHMDTFAIVNESTDSQLTHELLLRGAVALQKQSELHFAPLWKQSPSTVIVANSEDIQTADVHVTRIVDSIPEAPGALAYHTVDEEGRPLLVIGWDAIKSQGGDIWAAFWSAISHEICEERGNPYVNLNVDMPDNTHDTALEACDWTQGDLYDLDGHKMSNFVTPEFFNTAATAGTSLDFMGVCKTPLTVRPQGYCVLRDKHTGKSRVHFGVEVTESVQAAKTKALELGYNRAA